MKRFDFLRFTGLLLLCLGGMPLHSHAIVYVNRVLNPTPSDPCNYSLSFYEVQGNELWDANYQNAYGACAGLQPGPPFILESTLRVEGGDLSIQGGTIQANWQIRVDSGNTIRLLNSTVQLSPSVNILANAGGRIEASGTTFTGADGLISINFGSVGFFDNCSFQGSGNGLIYSFVPDSLMIDNCSFSTTGASGNGTEMVQVTGNLNPVLFSLTNSQFSTTAAMQDYVRVITTPTVRIVGNTFGPTIGLGISTGTLADLVMDNNDFQGIICPGAINANCGAVILNDVGIRSVRGNTGAGSTLNGIRMAYAGSIGAAGTGRMRSEPGFPFVLNTAMIIQGGDSLFIEPGTIMKVGAGDNINVYGHIEADNVVFTSQKDTTYDGNSTQLFNPAPGDWRGINIDGQFGLTASGRFRNCSFRYAGMTNYSIKRGQNAWLEVENCLLERADGHAIWLQDANPTEPNTYARILGNVIRHHETGLYDSQFYPSNSALIRGNRIIANEQGIYAWGYNNSIIDGNFLAGNRLDGIRFRPNNSPTLANNLSVANGRDGIFYESGVSGDSARIVNNHLLGNGRHGLSLANISSQEVAVSNNLIAYNVGYGVEESSPFTLENPYRHNAFWANGSGDFWEDNSNLLTTADLNQRSNSTQNQPIDPTLLLIDSGTVASVLVNASSFRTVLQVQGGNLAVNAWQERLLWNRRNNQFALILRNDSSRIILADTIAAIMAGDNFSIVEIETIPTPSPLADLGENLYYLPSGDYFGNPRVQQMTVDIGAMESAQLADPCPSDSILYVDVAASGTGSGDNWTDAMPDLQDAFLQLAICPHIREIWVKEGTYYPHASDRNLAFAWPDQVRVYGSFPSNLPSPTLADRDWQNHPSILSGNIGDPAVAEDNSYTVVRFSGLSLWAHLDGFVIEKSNTWDGSQYLADPSGVRIDNVDPLEIDMHNCLLQFHTGGKGAALSVRGEAAITLQVTHSRFYGNFSDYSGGVMTMMPSSSQSDLHSQFINCIFDANLAQDSGGVIYTRIISGGQVYNDFIHCTFFNNRGELDAGLDYSKAAEGTVLQTEYENCIIHMSSSTVGTPIARYQGIADLRLSFSFLQASACTDLAVSPSHVECLGFMVYGSSPQFADSSSFDYRLQAGSPCIGNADEYAALNNLTSDYAYLPRLVGSNADQGAHEYQGTTAIAPVAAQANWQVYPNPTRGQVSLRATFTPSVEARLSLYDLQGRLLWQKPWQARLDVSALPDGMYWLRLEDGMTRSQQAVWVLH